MKIKDIMGNTTKVANFRLAIRQCKLGLDSPFKMDRGHTYSWRKLCLYAPAIRKIEKYKRLNGESFSPSSFLMSFGRKKRSKRSKIRSLSITFLIRKY